MKSAPCRNGSGRRDLHNAGEYILCHVRKVHGFQCENDDAESCKEAANASLNEMAFMAHARKSTEITLSNGIR